MVLYNGLVFTETFTFEKRDVAFENGRITAVGPAGSMAQSGGVDAQGGYVLPGFVDIHTHGAKGYDFCDADSEGIKTMLAYYGSAGITSVVPATMSFNEPILADILDAAAPFFDREGFGAVLRGVNMEGPFISKDKRGAQNAEYIVDPALAVFDSLFQRCGGRIRLVDLAPELPGSLEFIRAISRKCTVSLAHTQATYDQAAAAFQAGAAHVTHLFNAMPPFLHREPGVVGAASDFAAHVEVISDGIHLHPAVVRAVFQWFGPERVCLISDCMRATGMPDGDYTLGGQAVHKEGNKPTLADGTIAGSATNLAECCRQAVGFGVPLEQAVRAATANPANAVGLDSEVGSITPGKRADFVLWNRDLQTAGVIVGGRPVLD